jgi:NAD-dependent dihydropyrimidine dehydrogenase PreA subunit
MIKKARRLGIKNIDEAVCTGCELCVGSCMMDVIYFDKEKEKAYAKYPDDCQACFLCVDDCPVEAITIDAVE